VIATSTKTLKITKARYLCGYKVELAFNDKTARTINFEPFLRGSTNPEITQFRKANRFRKFRIVHGNLMWGDFEMLFPIADLHRGAV
jgi:hypothetical protein